MARAGTIVNRFDLSGGYLTEFTELTYPENVTVDESNFTIEFDGSRRRRKGLDYEEGYVLHDDASHVWDDSSGGEALNVMEWRNVAGNADDNFVVVQVGHYLHFYDNDDTISSNKKSDVIDLTTYKAPSATDEQVAGSAVEGAYGSSRFFVTGKYIEPIYLSWDGTNISTTEINIIERDFEGADDGLEISTRPSDLSDEHNYNLRNQGWPSERINDFEDGSGNYPSNADIWHFGLYSDVSNDGRRSFDWRQVRDQDFGNSAAPKGRFLRDIFDTRESFNTDDSNEISDFEHDGTEGTITTAVAHGFSIDDTIIIDDTSFTYTDNDGTPDQTFTYSNDSFTVSDVPSSTQITFDHFIDNFNTNDPDASYDSTDVDGVVYGTFNNPSGEQTDARPRSVAFYSGRVWWSGIEDDRLGSKVYFSKVLEYEDQIGECYQEADPTSEHISDLVDTDGGVITISEMGTVLKMGIVGKTLVLFADNGIWNIGPGDAGYFTATSYSVRKISDARIASPRGALFSEGVPVVCAYQGIYALSEDQVSGFLQPQSMSFQTVQSFYKDIPDACKEYIYAAYNDISKTFYWSFGRDPDLPMVHDEILMFDTRREAFIKYHIKRPDDGPFVGGMVARLGYDDDDNKIKFLAVEKDTGDFTFANLRNDEFLDWKAYDDTGVDADGYLITSYEMGNDAARDKQTPVVTFVFKRTETGIDSEGNLENPGSCLMQARWDWSNHSNSNKWNPERQVYRLRRTYVPGSLPADDYADGHPVVWSRNKVRGRGRALNFKLRTEAGYDCHLLGWQITMTGNTET